MFSLPFQELPFDVMLNVKPSISGHTSEETVTVKVDGI
jgi:hypothetical protein